MGMPVTNWLRKFGHTYLIPKKNVLHSEVLISESQKKYNEI